MSPRPLARADSLRWPRTRELPLSSRVPFVDPLGLEAVRLRADVLLLRLPPPLADLDEDLRPRAGAPPLIEVVDVSEAMSRLRELGFRIGDLVPDEGGWESTALIDLPGDGHHRLVGLDPTRLAHDPEA